MKIINAKPTQCYKVLELVNKHSFVRLNETSGSLWKLMALSDTNQFAQWELFILFKLHLFFFFKKYNFTI
jgi:hypothetical protein